MYVLVKCEVFVYFHISMLSEIMAEVCYVAVVGLLCLLPVSQVGRCRAGLCLAPTHSEVCRGPFRRFHQDLQPQEVKSVAMVLSLSLSLSLCVSVTIKLYGLASDETYSAFGKYSDPLTSSMFCNVTALL